MVKYINTIKDLEAATYGSVGNNSLLKSGGMVATLHSGHDGYNTLGGGGSAAGQNLSSLYNVIYGQKVWSMLNQEINPLSVLPKRPYTSSGWRVMTKRPIGGSGAAFGIGTTNWAAANAMDAPNADELGGVDENHALSATGLQPIAPEYTTLFMSPKTIAHQFDYSELAAEMAKIDDGVGDLRSLIREDMGKIHAEVQSVMAVLPLENWDNASYAAIERNYTSLMKVVTNNAELEAMATANTIASNGSGTFNNQIDAIYGDSTSRAAGTSFMDSVVDYGSGYAAANVRGLTTTTMNSLIQSLRLNGGTPNVILTGYDTIQTIADLLQSQERFLERKEVIPSHNGVRGVKGREVGFRVATYFDIPMIPCKDMPQTGQGTTKVSDLLFLDTDHLWLAVMKPTQYFEDGINHGNPFGVNMLGNRGLFRTMGEVGCTFFKGQGKITNVQ